MDAPEDRGRPLVDWVLRQHPDTPKKRAKQWILAGRVSVDGTIIRQPNERLPDPGTALELVGRGATTLDCGAAGWQIHPRVAILYLDSAVAVVNKGPGLIAVPAVGAHLSALGILADFLAGKLRAQARGGEGRGRSLPPAYRRLRPRAVHRLDQYTSGVFCAAMNPAARTRLIAQLRAHTMQRAYVAYVEGRPRQPRGTWRDWLRLSPDELRQEVVSDKEARSSRGRALLATTHYEVIGEFPLAGGREVVTKLRLRLQTGRKHQIRVQAAHAGLPLVGDRTYHPQYHDDAPRAPRIPFDRQALHAEVLGLEHPDRPGTVMTWTAALPRDLRQLEAVLRAARRAGRNP
ncbi:RluA family pseudouridine synthase [bacterium]|nr:RluA family pseudouridine synthase [bacterium]